MPITEELKNVKKYESVGFTHDQAETLAETIEQAQVNGNESLKEFIRNENDKLRREITELKYDLLLKIFAIVTGTAGLLFAAIKLFT
ncbi:MAG: hypothetical protein ACUZ8O_14180 [Candidatus Anammoxibacter sp.]